MKLNTFIALVSIVVFSSGALAQGAKGASLSCESANGSIRVESDLAGGVLTVFDRENSATWVEDDFVRVTSMNYVTGIPANAKPFFYAAAELKGQDYPILLAMVHAQGGFTVTQTKDLLTIRFVGKLNGVKLGATDLSQKMEETPVNCVYRESSSAQYESKK